MTAAKDTQERRTPRCPRCGCKEIRQWDLVPVAYRVKAVDIDGECDLDFDADSEIVWDGSRHDGFSCRACGFEREDAYEFYPDGEAV